ncbi:MAG: translation initiation factor IF-2 N-terminal domain-containing protein, partial [Oscillospiraceae bacterium]|nr:translation initiation factor IF-2 N-terminal domain-containing protein [Oscillospiraceae bacterium]
MMIKYRVHEVAKDFKTNSKTIANILTEYATTPKNHMQVLEESELDLIFEYLTQHHQVANVAELYESVRKDEPKAEKAPEKVPEKQPEKPADKPKAEPEKKAPQAEKKPEAVKTPEKQPAQKPQQNASAPTKRVPQRRVIDTSGVTINIDKYDERLDNLVPERAQNMKRGKEKIGKKNQRGGGQQSSAKRRQEEREKMQRLQLEVAKKAPLKVRIPDEITVGELSQRMKKTSAEVIKKLIKMGVMAAVNEVIDYDTAAL